LGVCEYEVVRVSVTTFFGNRHPQTFIPAHPVTRDDNHNDR
jgi:hypothetical protein